ncbi:MAG: diguanylate cyclase (GGDEF)-like protein [Gammaproteobacteria bacterium]|jgi:diguanylate cyclase (GGDEF)-like protein
MKFNKLINQSIGLMLTSMLLASSLLIGLVISVVTLKSELNEHRMNFFEQSDDIFNLSVGGATSAAWTLDDALAHQVTAGILRKASVLSVEILVEVGPDDQQRLAYLEKSELTPGALTNWVAQKFFSDTKRMSWRLSVDDQGLAIDVGTLAIEFSPRHLASKYIKSTYAILIFGLIQSFLIGIVLLLVTRWLLTTPLQRAAQAVAQISPESLHKDHYSVPVPDIHRNNELGQLLHHTNRFLERLSTSQADLRQLATRDPLTGMANRMLIKEQLVNMLALASRTSRLVGVIFLDLDRFKTVNDSLGHDIGDKLLKAVAESLSDQVRKQDAVGRLGGDEFLFLASANEFADVIVLAERIIEALANPYFIDGHEIRTNASLGIAMYPENGDDADTLMRSADLAMYKAKADGVNRWHRYSEDMREALDQALVLETALTGAIHRKELLLHLQPQFRADNNELAGCEALLRWKYKGNWIAPFEFIRIAENTGLILEIGDWVIAEACRILQSWGDHAVTISVNVSGKQLGDVSFVSRIFDTVKKYDIEPRLIELEITETMLIENLDHCIERITELRSAGFKISIDDFGTGYSSLAYLTRLPIDELKIDRSFVSGSQRSPVVLNTIIAMGRALNLRVVAEGVETEEQRDNLIDSGCDLLQGYLLGMPMPVEEFENLFFKADKQALRKI